MENAGETGGWPRSLGSPEARATPTGSRKSRPIPSRDAYQVANGQGPTPKDRTAKIERPSSKLPNFQTPSFQNAKLPNWPTHESHRLKYPRRGELTGHVADGPAGDDVREARADAACGPRQAQSQTA